MTRPLFSSLALLWLTAALLAASNSPPLFPPMADGQKSPETNPVRQAQMMGHYRAVTLVYEGVVRGDLSAVRDAGISIWGLATPSGVPAAGEQIAEFVKLQGRRAAQASTLTQAADSAAGMLTLCGECHRSVGIRIAVPERPTPPVGGIVGHMLEHREAVEMMAEGLVAPSASRWSLGAERLLAAPLSSRDLPPDPGMTAAVQKSETDVHAIGKAALAASDDTTRTATFARLIASCANCHRLHSRIWGPRSDGK